MGEVHRARDTTRGHEHRRIRSVYASPFIGVRAPWESSGFRRRSVAIQVQSLRLSVSGPGLVKRPCRFSRGHAEASQRQNRGATLTWGSAPRPMCPHAGHLKTGLAMCRVERMRPSMSSSSARSPSRSLMGRSSRQRRRRCCTISGNQTRCASPAATADHSRLVLFPSGSRPSSSRRFPGGSRVRVAGLGRAEKPPAGGPNRGLLNPSAYCGTYPVRGPSRPYNHAQHWLLPPAPASRLRNDQADR